jgi:Janus kinase 2
MCQEFGQFAMVMDLAEGSLDKFTKAHNVSPSKQLPERDLFMFAQGIARGMMHLADHRIVHRDLAARNILLDHENTPKISDFGFSRVVGDDTAKGKVRRPREIFLLFSSLIQSSYSRRSPRSDLCVG